MSSVLKLLCLACLLANFDLGAGCCRVYAAEIETAKFYVEGLHVSVPEYQLPEYKQQVAKQNGGWIITVTRIRADKPSDCKLADLSKRIPAALNKYLVSTEKIQSGSYSVGVQVRAILGNPIDPDLSVEQAARRMLGWCAKSILVEEKSEAKRRDAISTLKRRKGDCVAVTHLAVAMLRHLGLPARSVHGVLMPNDPLKRPCLHRWIEYFLPDAGWRPCDATLPGGGITVGHIVLGIEGVEIDNRPFQIPKDITRRIKRIRDAE